MMQGRSSLWTEYSPSDQELSVQEVGLCEDSDDSRIADGELHTLEGNRVEMVEYNFLVLLVNFFLFS